MTANRRRRSRPTCSAGHAISTDCATRRRRWWPMTAEPRVPVTTALPCYAVVGKVNMGKSAVLATLLEEDDDRIIRISPEPGETTRCQMLSLVLDGSERLRFKIGRAH